MAGKIRS